MDEKRTLYIRDSKGVEYNLDVRGYNDMPHFKVMTDEELKKEEEDYRKRIKNEVDNSRFESVKRAWDRENRPWYKKLFN